MPSLLEALEEKYGGDCNDVTISEIQVSIFVPKLPPLKCVPEVLVLNDCNIDCAGESKKLKEKCNSVKELDLAQNNLQNWSEIFNILSHMPKVEFVNLSKNRLNNPLALPPSDTLTSLKVVVLNGTCLDWCSVEFLLKCLPALQELHLSLNDYEEVLIDTIADSKKNCLSEMHSLKEDTNKNMYDANSSNETSLQSNQSTFLSTYNIKSHSGVKILHFTGNPVKDWQEICKLGRVFPNLESLVLADCPLRSVQPIGGLSISQNNYSPPPHEHFLNLSALNLNSTNIATWNDIDHLSQFPSLHNLRVQNWPLWDVCDSTEHERRQLLIARLPKVSILNGGGVISAHERDDAERAFVRYYMDRPESDRPSRFNELIAIHGRLDPLVNIDLRPKKHVKITLIYGAYKEIKAVDVYRTVVDLKSRLEGLVGLSANKMRLFYVDQDLKELQGPEEMKYPHKQLYSYNIANGDEIIIDEKN